MNKFKKNNIIPANPKLDWSEYQKDIFRDIARGEGNTLVIAFAGSAKTTSLIQGSKYLPKRKSSLFCAFNKSIQEELRLRLGSYISCSTLHSLGFRSIKLRFPEVELNNNKCFDLVKSFIGNSKEDFELIGQICKCVSLCKALLADTPSGIEDIIYNYEIDMCDVSSKQFIQYISMALRMCKEKTDVIDFDDMIWFPFVYRLNVGKYDYVMIDECFPYNQYITTENGKEKIGSLFNKFRKNKPLPLIKSFNEKSNKFEYNKIINAWDHGVRNLIEIRCGKRKIRCTDNHRFLTNDGWVEAGKLKPGCLIKTSDPTKGQLQLAFNSDQEQIILGSFLGDGHISKSSNFRYRMEIIHGINQSDYCKWKASIFNCNTRYIEKNGFSQKSAISFNTKSFALGKEFPKNKAYCPQWILDELDERGLAIWFMDDGSSRKSCASISTCSFDEDSQRRFVLKLQEFGIKSKYTKYKGYYYIIITAKGQKQLEKLIAPYIHKNLSYKIRTLEEIDNYNWDYDYKSYGFTVVDEISSTNKFEKVYDLEIENNHNFIVCSSSGGKQKTINGLIAHNCQDLNKAQIELALSAVKADGRVIAVLDPNQAIYKFRGADEHVLDNLRKRLNPKELPLPICYRCPKKVVIAAQEFVPDIKPFDKAIEGEITELLIHDLMKTAKAGDYVISRYNAPLIKHCLRFLKNGKPANILGRDIGSNLLYLIKKSKKKTVREFLKWVTKWEKQEKQKLQDKYPNASVESISDKVECLRNLCEDTSSLKDVEGNIKMLFQDNEEKNIVLFSSIHKIKGKEADRVFVLADTLNASSQEELNLHYVSISRVRKHLFMVYKKKFQTGDADNPELNKLWKLTQDD